MLSQDDILLISLLTYSISVVNFVFLWCHLETNRMFQYIITFKRSCIIECYIFYFYLLYCFTFSVKHLILSVLVIILICLILDVFACIYLKS